MTKVLTIFHRCQGVSLESLGEALAAEGYAEFYAGPVDASEVAFTLHRVGPAILVRDDIGRRIATYADPARAVAHGFAHFDRPRRGRRRVMEGPCDLLPKAALDRPAMRYDPPDRFIRALATGIIVEMMDGPLDAPHLAFRLKSSGGAIHVVTPEGEIVGTFATALAAAVHGFKRLDREAQDRLTVPSPDQP